MSIRDQVLSTTDLTTKEIKVPEWGTSIKLREMSGVERDAWEDFANGRRVDGKLQNLRALVVARFALNADGERIFSDDDIQRLGTMGGKALDRIFQAFSKLNFGE